MRAKSPDVAVKVLFSECLNCNSDKRYEAASKSGFDTWFYVDMKREKQIIRTPLCCFDCSPFLLCVNVRLFASCCP